MEIQLFVKEVSGAEQTIAVSLLHQGVSLGRGPQSPLSLTGPGISREHLGIHVEDGHVFVTDLSANGSWVNGVPLPRNQKQRLQPDDVIELPNYEIRWQGPEAPSPEPPAPAEPVPEPTPEPVRAPAAPARAAPAAAAASPALSPTPAAQPVAATPGVADPVVAALPTPPASAQAPSPGGISALLGSFTGLDRMMVFLALLSIALVVVYLYS